MQLLPGASSPLAGGADGYSSPSAFTDDTSAFMAHGPLTAVNARVDGQLLTQLALLYGRPGAPQRKVGWRGRGGERLSQAALRAWGWFGGCWHHSQQGGQGVRTQAALLGGR